ACDPMPLTDEPCPVQSPTRSRPACLTSPMMRSMASSQEMGCQSSEPLGPRLSKGWESRRGLPWISWADRPRTQRKPWLSGWSGSPSTLRRLPPWTVMSMPQYVGWQFIGHIEWKVWVPVLRLRAGGEATIGLLAPRGVGRRMPGLYAGLLADAAVD